MDPLVLLIAVVAVAFFGTPFALYFSDREGWDATSARVRRFFRTLGKKPDTTMLTKLPETEAVTQWVEAFDEASGEKGMMQITTTDAKHQIIRYYYYQSSFGEIWPRWECKCGANEAAPVMSGGMKEAEERAKRQAAKHVDTQLENERLIEKNKEGPWAF